MIRGATKDRRRYRGLFAAMGAVSILTAGCGSSASNVSSSASSSQSTSSNGGSNSGLAYAQSQVQKYLGAPTFSGPPALAKAPDLTGKTIWYIPITNSVDSLAGIGTTMAAALSHLGATVHVCDGGALPTTVSNCMSMAGQQGAAAVVTSYIEYNMVPTAFQSLEAKNVPILVAGEPVPSGVTPSANLQFLDANKQADLFQELNGYLTIADSKGKANVLVVKLADSPETIHAYNLEIDVFKKYCPGCKVSSVSMQTATVSQLPSAVSAALVSNPGTNYVNVPSDAFLPPVVGGIQSAGFANKVKVIASDGGLAGLHDVAAGTVAYDPGSPIEWQGWQDANAVIRMLSGLSVIPEGAGPTRIFGASNIRSLDLTSANYLSTSFYGISQSAFEAPYLSAWLASK